MPPKRAAAIAAAAASQAANNATAAGDLSDDSFDGVDDLFDELEEDEDGADKKPRRKNDFSKVLAGKLARPRHVTMSVKHLHDLIQLGEVTLSAQYQRDVVWPEAKMIGLVQSLFLNYYVPPILFAVENANMSGKELRICMDGKQRCTSIINFMMGRIPFISPATKERFWYNKYLTTKQGKQLPEPLKREFDMIQLAVVEYDDLPEDLQRDIFQRVQLGVSLSAAEKLQAIASPWSDWVGELEKKYATHPDTLGQLLSWDQSRGKPFQNLLGFIMLVIEPNKHVMPSMPTMKKFISRADQPEAGFKSRVQMALALFVNLATNHADAAFGTARTRRVSPVEFWFIGYMIYTRMNNASLATIAGQVGQIRAAVHGMFPGHVFSNTQVSNFLYTTIAALPKKRKPDDTPAAEGFEDDEDVDEREVRAAKRARRAEEEDPSYVGDKVERSILPPERVATRAKVTGPSNASSSTSTTPPVAQAHKPAPVNTAVAAAQHPGVAGALPTPQTSTSQQQYNNQQQQMYNQRPVHAQYQSPIVAPSQLAYPQPNPTVLAPGQPQAQAPTWAANQNNGQTMTAEQMRHYHLARAQQQIQLRQQQQQQQQQQNYHR